MTPLPVRTLNRILGFVAILAAIALSIKLRLVDPLASPVLPAEDTFNHMALVQEHVRDGSLDPLNPDGRLYPPGMHVWIAAVWAFTGADLYQIMRFGPVLFGAIGVLGMGLLLWRTDGPIAAGLAAVVYAIMPEAIRRTTMMAPTAMDLALIPFLLYSIIALIQGRHGHAFVAAPMALFLVFTHPWLLTILALTGAVFGIATLIHPWPRSRGASVSGFGIAIAVAILGVAWGLSLTGCAGACGPGFDDVSEDGQKIDALAPLVTGAALLVAAFFALAPPAVDRFLAREPRARPRWIARACVSLLLVGALYVITKPAFEQGMPPSVNLPINLGRSVLIAAIIGVALVPFAPSPGAYVGLGLSAVTYPFVIYNPFNSPFWSHRTMVFLGIGLAILAGTAAATIARFLVAAAMRIPAGARNARVARPMFAALAVLIFLSASTTQVYATTPGPPGWYRLYNPCEQDALGQVAARAADTPDLIVIAGSWQAKLVLAAITPNANRVWFKSDFFTSSDERALLEEWGPPMIVVIEWHLPAITPNANLSFLNETSWQKTGEWCDRPKVEGPSVRAYERERVVYDE